MSLIINHVTYKYNPNTPMEQVALDDVSLEIREGEFVALIGHTGSGKSTLVQQMNGLLKPSDGGVYYNGRDIFEKDYPIKELRSKVGLVFQYPEHQLFEVDVFSDVCFGPRNMGLSKKETELRAYEALKSVGVGDELFYVSPFELSGGQKRKVAIAGVLAMKPEVLVLDEPTAGLDPAARDEILERLDRIRRESNTAIVLVSHSMDDVALYANRIVVMDKGKVVFDDSPNVVFSHFEELENIGLMAPQISYAMNKLKSEGINVRTDIYTVDEAVREILNVT